MTTAAADWPDIDRLFGVRGEPSRCWCGFFAPTGTEWSASTPEQRKVQLRARFDGGAPAPGVLAFRGGTLVERCPVDALQRPGAGPADLFHGTWVCSWLPGSKSSATRCPAVPSSALPAPPPSPKDAPAPAPRAG